MKKVEIKDVVQGKWFEYNNNVCCISSINLYKNIISITYLFSIRHSEDLSPATDVNLHWWEALKNPSKWQIMKAYVDGAIIERMVLNTCIISGEVKWDTVIFPIWN